MRKGVKKKDIKEFEIALPSNYIGAPDETILNALHYLDLTNEDGDSFALLERYDADVPLKMTDLCHMLTSMGYSIFTLSHNLSDFNERINLEVRTNDEVEKPYVMFNMNAVMGLPGDKPQEEIREVKEFLTWLKDESLAHPRERITFCFHRGFGDTQVEISAENNDELEKQLNQKMNDKIKESAVLTQWVENQKKALEVTHPHLETLWAPLHGSSLFTYKEEKQWYEALKNSNSQYPQKTLRKVKKKF